MNRLLARLLIALSFIGFLVTGDLAEARTFGEWLKAVGNSIAHPQKRPSPRPRKEKKGQSQPKDAIATATPTPVNVAPTPTPDIIRVASVAPARKGRKRDLPYGIPVPNRQGFVTSPYAPAEGLVDVRGFPSETEVKDPYSGKIFLTP